MSGNLRDSTRISMQRAMLQPFPELTTAPLSSLTESQRLDTLIQNLEAHHRNVKATLLATSISTPSALPATHSSSAPIQDPRLASRGIKHTPGDSQDALLASLKIPYKHERMKSISSMAANERTVDEFFGELSETLERLGEYDRGNVGVVERLKAERERARERERVEQMGKEGGYHRERDPRLRR